MPSNRNGSGRNQRNNPYQLEELFHNFNRTPAGIAWRWRTELAVLAAALRWLDSLIALNWAGIALGGLVAVVLAVPHSRRFITRRLLCVLARHRLQRLCFEARLHTRSGRLPLIVWIRPTKVEERAWILCRAGVCAEDFDAHIGELRAACYARDARVIRKRRWSHLVTIDIVRRDTLAASTTITSPLERLTALYPPPRSPPRCPSPSPAIHPPSPNRPSPPEPAGGPRARPARGPPADIPPHPPHLPLPKEAPIMTITGSTPPSPDTGLVPTFPFSMFDPVHLGVDENGEHVYVNLAERNMLLGGAVTADSRGTVPANVGSRLSLSGTPPAETGSSSAHVAGLRLRRSASSRTSQAAR
jgi:hypothetical protein